MRKIFLRNTNLVHHEIKNERDFDSHFEETKFCQIEIWNESEPIHILTIIGRYVIQSYYKLFPPRITDWLFEVKPFSDFDYVFKDRHDVNYFTKLFAKVNYSFKEKGSIKIWFPT